MTRATMTDTCSMALVVFGLLLGACSDDGGGDPTDAAPPGKDGSYADLHPGLPDGYTLWPCSTPGQSCEAHDKCAIDPICGPDKRCYPSSLQDCSDQLACTDDICMGQGLCKHQPRTGSCALPVRVGGAGDAGAGDGGAAADAGGAATTEIRCFQAGDTRPGDPCQKCDPDADPLKWTGASGGACDDGNACTKNDYCNDGTCKGTYYGSQCADSYGCTDDLCDGKGGCLGNKLKSDWCLINGVCYKDGGKHPSGSCMECDVSKSQSSWTPISNTCQIDGVCYKKGDQNPGKCAECDPAASTTAWTVKGTTHCLIAKQCVASGGKDSTGCGVCDPTKNKVDWTAVPGLCKIAGKCHAKGAKHSGGCAECDPAVSSTAWTVKGTTHCLISDSCIASGTKDSINCAVCDPTKNKVDWSPLSGLCKILGTCYSSGAKHPDGCGACKPATEPNHWTLTSTTDCLIDDKCYKPNTVWGCYKCDPTVSQTKWTKIAGCNALETTATPSSSGGGSGSYGPVNLNDGKLEASCKFCWISASSTPGKSWLQYEWKAPVTPTKVEFDTAAASSTSCSSSAGRTLAGGTLQYWSGSAWVKIGDISGKTDDWSYSFTGVKTTKLRLYGAHATSTTGQKSNPMIFEWKVYGQ